MIWIYHLIMQGSKFFFYVRIFQRKTPFSKIPKERLEKTILRKVLVPGTDDLALQLFTIFALALFKGAREILLKP